jgi:RND family efflux transporter MFP subunit
MSETADDPGTPAAGGAASLRIDRARPRKRGGGVGVWIVGGLLLLVAGGFAWSFLGKATGTLGGRTVREGRAVRSSPESGRERTTASGYVVARTRAAISPKYPGKLVKILVDVGDEVTEGQLLAEMDHAELDAAVERGEAEVARSRHDIQASERAAEERKSAAAAGRSATEATRAAVREAEARRDDSKREAERLERLLGKGIVTESERDRASAQAKMDAASAERSGADLAAALLEEERASKDAAAAAARVESARSGLASSEASLRETKSRRDDSFIRANFRGRVLRKEAEVGEVIAPATTGGGSTRGALLTLADFDTLEMEVDVFERDVSLVQDGAPARIVLDAYPRDPFPGKVRQVVPTADRQKATVQVKVAFEKPDPRVLPEMGGKVVFLTEGTKVSSEAERVMVPAAALADRAGKRGVFLLEREGKGTRVRFAPLELGPVDGDRVTVKSGLAGGERVVLEPGQDLKDGDAVTAAAGQ